MAALPRSRLPVMTSRRRDPAPNPNPTPNPNPDPDGRTDNEESGPPGGPAPAKVVAGLLADARSLARRTDKLAAALAIWDEPDTAYLTQDTRACLAQLVRHLEQLDRRRHAELRRPHR